MSSVAARLQLLAFGYQDVVLGSPRYYAIESADGSVVRELERFYQASLDLRQPGSRKERGNKILLLHVPADCLASVLDPWTFVALTRVCRATRTAFRHKTVPWHNAVGIRGSPTGREAAVGALQGWWQDPARADWLWENWPHPGRGWSRLMLRHDARRVVLRCGLVLRADTACYPLRWHLRASTQREDVQDGTWAIQRVRSDARID